MTAHTTIRIDETVRERAHRRSISIHCPTPDEMEMAARVDLATIRDQATVGVSRATDSAAAILSEVSRLATSAVFAPATASKLIRIRAALMLSMEAARAVDRVERGWMAS